MKGLGRRALEGLGWELRRRPGPAELEGICRRFDVDLVEPLAIDAFRDACPPLFPVPTEVPDTFPLESFPSVEAALENESARLYFRVSDEEGKHLVSDSDGHLYLARQRMLYSSYVRHFGPSLRGRRVLDVGCSSGYFSFFCSRLGADEVVSLDNRPEHRDQFRLFGSMLDLPGTCRYQDLDVELELGTLGEQFDLVLALGILYHVYDHPRFLGELHGLTKRMLVIDTYCFGGSEGGCWAQIEETRHPRMSVHGPVLQPSLPWLLKLLQWVGFSRIACMRFPKDRPDRAGYGELRRAMLVASKDGA